jgi:DNA-binding MarR family transcriptional regulator
MVDKGDREEPPATIRKHIDQVQAKRKQPVVYVRERITAYNRKRLVEQKIPFLVPGNQMYLPMLGIDFREHFRKPRPDKTGLRPSSQAVLIYALVQDAKNLGPTALATKLGYSAMAMSRALDELEAARLGESSATGRGHDRWLHFQESKREMWKKAQPLLRNPVKSRHTIHMTRDKNLPGPQAGLSALAHYSMLAEPGNITIALSREDWKSLRQKDAAKPAMPDEPGAMTVEVWGYAPALFAGDGWVDRLSLYLSLRDTKDERVQATLDQMIKEVAW